MSSSTFTQRWASVNDLTENNNNNNKRLTSFYLQSSPTESNKIIFTISPSQSLSSLIDGSTSKYSNNQFEQTKPSSSRVADIIHRFESHNVSSMNNNSNKVSPPPNRNVFTKQWENKFSRTVSTPATETPSQSVLSNTKKSTRPQPIIIYERITNADRPFKTLSTPPPIPPKDPIIKTFLQNPKIPSKNNFESDTDSAIHTMASMIKTDNNMSDTISRSNTIDSNDSSSSLSVSLSTPHFALPTIASTQKQRDINTNTTTFKRNCESPPLSVTSFTRKNNDDYESQQRSTLSTRFSTSEINLAEQYRNFSSLDAIRSDSDIFHNSLNKKLNDTNLPLKYKRDSFLRLYGPDALQQHNHKMSHDVVLEEDINPPFSPRIVTIKKNKSINDEYELLEFLGRGKFGEVKKCRERSTKHLLAAKVLQLSKEQDRIEALNEIEIMKALQHPRLLQLYDAFETKGEICLIMELINGGELFERVIDDDFILTERLCELYMMQICEGVSFMHSCNIIHLDMKPENILCLNRNGHRIKIIDFGLARKFDPTKQLKVLFGTPEFVAPEVINFDRVGYGTDMWSVGVICYVLLSGLSPFMGENDNDTYANINRANYDFDDEAFTDISDEAKDFISKLLIKNKDKRLQANECLAHSWLTRRPKLISVPKDEDTAEKKLSTKKLRRFVIRRRWQKAVNALLALKRMGMTL